MNLDLELNLNQTKKESASKQPKKENKDYKQTGAKVEKKDDKPK